MKDIWKDLWALKQAVNQTKGELLQNIDVEESEPEMSLTVSAGVGDEDLERLENLIRYPGEKEFSLTVSADSNSSEALEKGQIRHISPEYVEGERDLYVLISEVISEDTFEVYAFSSMPYPAFAEELSTGIDSAGLEVICLWNKVVVSGDVLNQSWQVKVDTTELMADVDEILQAKQKKLAMERKYEGRIGTRFAGVNDPRWDYFEEECGVLNGLVS